MCGEKLSTTSTDIHPAGSPPRMRGKGAVLDGVIPALRITPACAGKRGHLRGLLFLSQDHPRVCGEKPFRSNHSTTSEGSPPRVRGKARLHTQLDDQGRITPACAGKSIPRRNQNYQYQDHPRVCGEKIPCAPMLVKFRGSPPRVRGKVMKEQQRDGSMRITPACAGKRVVHYRINRCGQDHPRVCGEKTKKIP